MEAQGRRNIFVNSLILLVSSYIFLKLIFPFLAGLMAGTSVNLPIPGTLFLWYMILIAIGFFIYITCSEKDLQDFVHPILEAIRGRGGIYRVTYRAVLVLLPLFVGYQVYDSFVPKVAIPAVTRQQHPGMSHPGAAPYVDMQNPFRELSAEMLAEFVATYDTIPDQEGIGDALPKKVDASELGEAEPKKDQELTKSKILRKSGLLNLYAQSLARSVGRKDDFRYC